MDINVSPKALLIIIPAFIFIICLERWLAKRKNLVIYSSKDSFSNIAILLLRFSLNLAIASSVLLAILHFFANYNLHLTEHLNKFWYWASLIIFQDFLYYWFHRYSHECRIGWASHVVHHSSNYLNYTTAVRESVTYLFSAVWLFWIPLCLLGYSVHDITIALAIGLGYQFYLHTQLITSMGSWFEYVFNTPSHHRVHHARNPQYINKNYAGIFILWDRLFGTFTAEEETPEYGLVHRINNFNPFYVLFHGWYEMFREVIKRRSLKYLFVFPKPAENI
jgi:sterol desaturase/sphingolipid hydroxylase (fatty acid hydroxylase superfamily)